LSSYFAVFEGESLAGASDKPFFQGCLLARWAAGGAVIHVKSRLSPPGEQPFIKTGGGRVHVQHLVQVFH
jgi:hypothetical protein